MKEKKIIFRKLTVRETAEIMAARNASVSGNGWKSRYVSVLDVPGEVPITGDCSTDTDSTYLIGNRDE